MTPSTLLTTLTTPGCTLRSEGDTLHISPSSLLTPELRAHIREHKAALLALLTPDNDPGPWRYHSAVLGEELWFAWTPADVEALRAEGVVAYTPDEIIMLHVMKTRELEGFDERLRVIHRNKQVWGAEVSLGSVNTENVLTTKAS